MTLSLLRTPALAGLLAITLVVGGCATPAYYVSPAVPPPSLELGVVENVRPIVFQGPYTGLGALSGAALGGWAGSGIGAGSGNAAAIVGGVLIGSMIGGAAEAEAAKRPGVEVTVRLDTGRMIAVVQDAGEAFAQGDRIRVMSDGYRTRVTH